MRVLITGGGGNLGRVLAPALEEAGYEPILMDNRELETAHQMVRGDVRDETEVLQDLRDVSVVVHAAALHGIHLERYTTDDFWDLTWRAPGTSMRPRESQGLARSCCAARWASTARALAKPGILP